jgi:hypothetical protein
MGGVASIDMSIFNTSDARKTIQEVEKYLKEKPTSRSLEVKKNKTSEKIRTKQVSRKSDPNKHRGVYDINLLAKHVDTEDDKVTLFANYDSPVVHGDIELTPLYLINNTEKEISISTVDGSYANTLYQLEGRGYVDAKNLERQTKGATCGNSFFAINIPEFSYYLSYMPSPKRGTRKQLKYSAYYYTDPEESSKAIRVESNSGIGFYTAIDEANLSGRTISVVPKTKNRSKSKFIRNVQDARGYR